MRRIDLTPLLASASAGFAAWISLASLAVSTHDTSSRFGFLAPLWLAPLLVAGFVLAAWALRLSRNTSLPLFFSLVLLLPWIPGRVPAAFLVWTGPVVVVVWLVVAIGMVIAKKRGREPFSGTSRKRFPSPFLLSAALAFAAYLAGGWWLSGILPGGDEPHYLMITQSLLHDGDIRIENNHIQEQYRSFFSGTLRPHYLKRGVNGEIYSVHAPGLAVIVAPAFALFGYPGVVVFLALVSAGGSALLWRAAYSLTGDAAAAWFAWAAGALGAPFFFEAFAVFPDGVGATVVLFAALPLFEPVVSTRRWIAVGVALALLPWLHTRFAILSAVLGLVLFLRLLQSPDGRWRILPFLAAPVVSAVAWFSFFWVIYGQLDPSAPYGGDTQTKAGNILNGFPALLFDHQFGVLPNAPVYAFCVAGLVAMGRRRPRAAMELTAVALSYMLAVSAFHMWWGGASAPARFLAPILPMLAIPAAWLWHATPHRSTRAIGVATLFLSVVTTAALAVPDGGVLAYNVRDGYGRLAEWINPLVDVALGLPSFFRHAPGGLVLRAGIWIGFAAAAAVFLRVLEKRSTTRAAFALATPASLAVAVMCALTSVWTLDAVAASNPQKSQLALLGSYDTRARPIGTTLSPLAFDSAATMLHTIAVVTPVGRGGAQPGTLLLVPDVVPGGVYELRPGEGAPSAGKARLVIGRQARESRVWDLASDFRSGAAMLGLPVSVGSLIVTGDRGSPPGVLTLHPTTILEGPSRVTSDIARRVERWGRSLVYFFDLNTYPEGAGFWIRGGRGARFVVARDEGSPLQMFVRNAAAENQVTIEIDGEEQSLALRPSEERTLPVPFDDRRPGVLIDISSTSGFRPSEVEPGSTDMRFLGVWIEFR